MDGCGIVRGEVFTNKLCLVLGYRRLGLCFIKMSIGNHSVQLVLKYQGAQSVKKFKIMKSGQKKG